MPPTRRWPFALLMCLLTVPAVRAEQLPAAEEVIARHVEATGGKEAFDAIENRLVRGRIDIPAQGLKGNFTLWQAPGKALLVTEIQGFVTVRQGHDGKTAWETNDLAGPRLLTGDERGAFIRSTALNVERNLSEHYGDIKTAEVAEAHGEPVVVVELTPKGGGGVERWSYSRSTGRLVQTERTVQTMMGPQPVRTVLSDYRPAGPLTLPHRREEQGTMTMALTIDSIEHNVDLPAETFAVPEPVRQLMEAEGEAAAGISSGKPLRHVRGDRGT